MDVGCNFWVQSLDLANPEQLQGSAFVSVHDSWWVWVMGAHCVPGSTVAGFQPSSPWCDRWYHEPTLWMSKLRTASSGPAMQRRPKAQDPSVAWLWKAGAWGRLVGKEQRVRPGGLALGRGWGFR